MISCLMAIVDINNDMCTISMCTSHLGCTLNTAEVNVVFTVHVLTERS